ncbi:MAG: hypothetical protein VKJ02_13955 [Snowella sp.]|nr:hypothetical protein [Snowella sp.]
MNPIIYLLFKSRRPLSNRDTSLSNSDRGFMLPLALMIGLVLIVASLGMIASSQSGQRDTSSQKTTAEGLSAAEAGVTRILDLVNQNKYVAEIPDCVGTRDASGRCLDDGGTAPSYTPTNTSTKSWANYTSTHSDVQDISVCTKPPSPGAPLTPQQEFAQKIKAEAIVVNNQTWKNLDPSNPNKGQYRLVSYTFDSAANQGTLTVEGRVYATNVNSAGSRITVSFPVQPNQVAPTVPGVWLLSGKTSGSTYDATGSNQIQGNVLVNDCNIPISSVPIAQPSPPPSPPYSVAYTKQTMPELPPAICTSPSPGWSFPSPSPSPAVSYTTPVNTLNDPSGNIVLPRAGDTSVARTLKNGTTVNIYEYCVNQITSSGNNDITITPGQRVTLYLRGEIGGNNEIIHSCLDASNNPISGCNPADFQIFAYGQPVGGTRPKICLTGNRKLEAFILAPEYTIGVAGSGGGAGGVKGTVWAYDWSNSGGCGSNTSNIVVEQTASWGDMYGIGLPENQPPTIQNLASWKRQQR